MTPYSRQQSIKFCEISISDSSCEILAFVAVNLGIYVINIIYFSS